MRAGFANRRLRVDSPTQGVDADKAPTIVFVPYCVIYAQVVPVQGKQVDTETARANGTSWEVTCAWTPKRERIDQRWRFVDMQNGAIFDVTSILPIDGRNIDIKFGCVTGVTRG